MSTVRRMKERGGGGGKIAAPPAAKISPISSGKENSRPTSRVRAATQKPSIRPMARVDKSAAVAEETRVRRSASSVPRGRSSSPFEFTRGLSDLKKNPSRVSMGSSQRRVNGVCLKGLSEKSGERSDLEKRVIKEFVKNGGESEVGFQEKGRERIRVVGNGGSDVKRGSMSSGYVERSNLGNTVLKDFEKGGGDSDGLLEDDSIRALNGGGDVKDGNLRSSMVKRTEIGKFIEKSTLQIDRKSSKFSEEVRAKSLLVGVSNCPGVVRENAANKYPSKLHEKLAFLEGKVKRIASDIKRTKEILDMNNQDSSKMMLSDIHEKITGIEKAMVHVVGSEGDAKMGLIKSRENQEAIKEDKAIIATDAKSLVNGLNDEELEARLFPHHKLMRDRTLSKTISTNVDEEKESAFENNAITLEFLASLSKGESQVVHEADKIQEMEDTVTSSVVESSSQNASNDGKGGIDALVMADEKLNGFDYDPERVPVMICEEELEEDNYTYKLNDIGHKTSTGGWFVSEGESVLLAHDDGSCSFYDIANCEEKAEYKPPAETLPNMWCDCWIIRAPTTDGGSGRYVVAASAGNSLNSGFCSWDFYTKEIQAFHIEDETTPAYVRRTVLGPLPNNTIHGRNALSASMANENPQWWYKPCGPLIVSTASCQRTVQIYDIRDGDKVMNWELQKPVLAMDYSSPLQWRNRGKVVVAEMDGVSLWDVSSISSHALMSVSSSGRRISSLHVNNTDAELGGGVRQRVSSVEAEGNDGVFCTQDSINVLDFRHPSGMAFKIPKVGVNAHSTFSRGDSIYIGCSNIRSSVKKQYSSQIQQFSLRKQRLLTTFSLPESNAHDQYGELTQVWGNSSLVMGVCRLGLFVFDSLKDDGLPLSFSSMDCASTENVKEVIGPDDMHYPSFDYLSSRVLLISKDRPARWRYLL